jgi:hypothetical protein
VSVSRLDCGNGASTAFWITEEATTPNGTIDLAIRSTHSPNSGRCLVLCYAAENNTAVTGSMTIGGVAPTVEIVNTYDLATDLQTYVAIWDDAAIESMSGSTASINGTWPTTTTEAWSYNMFMNVDQTSILRLGANYTEHGSIANPATFDVPTDSTADDMIIVFAAADSSGSNITDTDTLAEFEDTGTGLRFVIAEGPGGDAATTMTPTSTASWLSYGLVLRYHKYALHIEWAQDNALRTTTSSSFVAVNSPNQELTSNMQTGARDYFTVSHMLQSGQSTNVAYIDGNAFFEGQAEPAMTETNNREPRRTTASQGQQHFAFDIVTTGAQTTYPNNKDFQNHFRSNGTDNVRQPRGMIMSLDMTDIEVDDYVWNDDATLYDALDNTGWTSGANATIPRAGDWLFWGYCHCLVDPSFGAIRIKLVVDGTDQGGFIELGGEDSAEQYCHGFVIPVAGLGAGAVVQIEFQTDSATAGVIDVDTNRLFGLRMDQFDDHFMEYDATNTTLSSVNTDFTVVSTPHTTKLNATADYFIGCYCLYDVTSSAQLLALRLDETTDGDLVGTVTDDVSQNDATDVVPGGPIWGIYPAIADAQSKTFNAIVQEGDNVTVAADVIDSWQWGFSTTFARSGPHEIFYGDKTNTLLRM